MGARISQPRAPAGTMVSSLSSKPDSSPSLKNQFPRRFNSRTIVAPAAAFIMALLLFVYARTSIRAAKANAQRHRDADTGGRGLSLLNEHRRRHGLAEKVEGDQSGTVAELGKQLLGENGQTCRVKDVEYQARSEDEEKFRLLKGRRYAKSDG